MMKMANGWTVIADVETGIPTSPGQLFRDVHVGIGRRGRQFRVVVIESWGSNQVYREAHDHTKIVAIGAELQDALAIAKQRAGDTKMSMPLVVQALSQAEDEAIDTLSPACEMEGGIER
jgi:hypothetical protein